MPIIGAFIGFGLIATVSCYLPEGWVKTAFGALTTILITYLLPLLIAFLGGKLIADIKGGVVGAMFAASLIVAGQHSVAPSYVQPLLNGADMLMFLGAMIVGPLGGIAIKYADKQVKKITPTGFEMLFTNLSIGIVGAILMAIGYFAIGYPVIGFTWVLGKAVNGLEKFHGLPLMSIIVEPAKVLFLNNAINHGVFTPLGTAEASDYGRSILFMIESNPGPGTGLLLGYILFNKGDNRRNAIGALPIHLLGGIHEVYFPFVILMPILIIPLILAGVAGVALEQLLGGGLQAPASPGSIIMEYIMTPSNLSGQAQLPGTLINHYPGSTYIANTAGILGATAISLLGSAICFKFKKPTKSLQESQATVTAMKAESKGTYSASNDLSNVKTVVFACDAGMGSSAMGATKLKKIFHSKGIKDIDVIHKSVSEVPQDAKLIVVHESLKNQVVQRNPNAKIVSIKDFMNAPEYETIAIDLQKNNVINVNSQNIKSINKKRNDKILSKKCIQLGCQSETVKQAISRVGKLLLDQKCISKEYIDGMVKRDKDVSVAIGNLIAIPHAVNEDRKYIKQNGLSVATYKKPIDWHDTPVQLVIGIAVNNEDHMNVLQNICNKLTTETEVINLVKSNDMNKIYRLLTEVENEN